MKYSHVILLQNGPPIYLTRDEFNRFNKGFRGPNSVVDLRNGIVIKNSAAIAFFPIEAWADRQVGQVCKQEQNIEVETPEPPPENVIISRSGQPFATEGIASRVMDQKNLEDTHEVTEYMNGYAITPKA